MRQCDLPFHGPPATSLNTMLHARQPVVASQREQQLVALSSSKVKLVGAVSMQPRSKEQEELILQQRRERRERKKAQRVKELEGGLGGLGALA